MTPFIQELQIILIGEFKNIKKEKIKKHIPIKGNH